MDYEKLFEEKSGFSMDDLQGENVYRFNTPWGFFVVQLGRTDGIFFVYALSGDGKRLVPYILGKGKELGYKKVRFFTKRNPKAWERKYGFKQTAYVMEGDL